MADVPLTKAERAEVLRLKRAAEAGSMVGLVESSAAAEVLKPQEKRRLKAVREALTVGENPYANITAMGGMWEPAAKEDPVSTAYWREEVERVEQLRRLGIHR